jgi:KUP system potassium uptake protein
VAVEQATIFLGRETVFPTKRPEMPRWRDRLFAWIAHNTATARPDMQIAAERVVEMGMPIELREPTRISHHGS